MIKQCSRCHDEYPATSEYFFRNKRSKDGFQSQCKSCKNITNHNWNIENREHRRKYRLENSSEIHEKRIEYYDLNKDFAREYSRNYYWENREEALMKVEDYRKSNPEKIKERRRVFYEKNKDRILHQTSMWQKANKEKKKQYTRKWTIKNREKVNFKEQRRRTKRKGLKSDLTIQEWEMIKKQFDDKCAYCGCSVEKLEKDHFVPLTKKGEFTLRNIIPACRRCNASKGNSNFQEWYLSQDFYDPKRMEKINNHTGEQLE